MPPSRDRSPGVGAPGIGSEGKTLTIPRSITVRGRIRSCERLLVEGVVETADIGGTVEGSLTVRGILPMRASGRIRGETIFYGELEIERGGTVIGMLRQLQEKGRR